MIRGLPSRLVQSQLAGHSVLGLAASVLLYICCVSGTLAVFYPDLERWEQPAAPESQGIEPAVLDTAAAAAMARTDSPPDHLSFALPTPDVPRLTVHAGDATWFVGPDGALGGQQDHGFTSFLAELHYALNLPVMWGLVVVGILGVIMIGLIVTGLLAHPSLVRDAFHWRRGRGRLAEVDLHNRLGVWAAPFHLMIATTGAFIGLMAVLFALLGAVSHGGDAEAVGEGFYAADPAPTGIEAPLLSLSDPVARFMESQPQRPPFYLVVHEPGTTAQTLDIGVHLPRGLAWAEVYRFDGAGEAVGSYGWSDGEAGKQLYASTFRLHFGHFGGLPVKILWFLLGAALCVTVVSGVRIWLARRAARGRPAPRLARAWVAVTWGVPLAVVSAALLDLLVPVPAVLIFWLLSLLLTGAALAGGTSEGWSRSLRGALVGVLIALPAVHLLQFGGTAVGPAGLTVNVLWLLLALAIGASLIRSRRPTEAAAAVHGASPVSN